jgi:RND family efflux transporter MFP subunit
VQKLYDEKVTTLEQLQDAETALDIAAASVKAVDFNLLYSSIYAPSDGRILKRFVEPGELVSAGTPVFLFGSSVSDWIVRVGVTDAEVIRLRINDTASVSFDMYPEKSFPAHVSEIAETADPLSGTYEIELTMGKSEYRLISGFIAKLKIIPSLKEDLFVIPVESLVEGDGRKGFVYVLERPNNRVRKAPVLIRYIFDDAIAVEYGLKEGDEIITMGTAYLTEGARVKIAETAPNENLKSNS